MYLFYLKCKKINQNLFLYYLNLLFKTILNLFCIIFIIFGFNFREFKVKNLKYLNFCYFTYYYY